MAITSPRIRLALVALAVAAIAFAAFQLGQQRTPPPQPAAKIRTFSVQLVDSFDLSRGVGPRALVRTRVTKLDVEPNGWRVYASITNDTNRPIMIFQPENKPYPVLYPHQGMSLVITPSSKQLAEGNNQYTISSARTFTPAISRVLPPHQKWTGSFAGTDAVPGNRKIYIGFGEFSWNSQPHSGSTSQAIVIR